ncbi:GNAT family protein [Paenibacillus sp. D2_2]|uniref:GNAT family N-acetyltransferase n=1 Tax=Paenibacillus sp. D2_2 TaxID=3073092 RepID=UPI002814E66D|nr:GNAT family protein [Paenibacillus sp. D2_2]WMT39635.1 GNAT family protein [Paenibacillus sp. D2_2]
MRISILRESDAQAYQQVRLDSLRNDPSAFGSTYDREAKFSLETVAERIRPSSDKFVLGAFGDDGHLYGIVTFMRDTGMKTHHKGNVFGMYVVPEKRGTGLGRELMGELIRRTREMEGIEQINLTVVSNNDNAKRLYLSLGFEIYGQERNALKYEDQYYDDDLMVLRMLK